MDTLDDTAVSHFIPSVKLTGSRDEKLRTLDTFIHHLLIVRHVLSGDARVPPLGVESYRTAGRPWRAFGTGMVTGAVMALLIEATMRWVL